MRHATIQRNLKRDTQLLQHLLRLMTLLGRKDPIVLRGGDSERPGDSCQLLRLHMGGVICKSGVDLPLE